MTLKTLKDIDKSLVAWIVGREALTKEVIKWIELDIRLDLGLITDKTKRWMERFNITEEELSK